MMREIKLDETQQKIYDLLCAKTKSGRLAWKRGNPGSYFIEFGGGYAYRACVTMLSGYSWPNTTVVLRQRDEHLIDFTAPDTNLYDLAQRSCHQLKLLFEKAVALLESL